MPNPYSFGPLVTNPDMFFGREAELETLCTRLRNMQSTSVVGLRRIGKSSLLYQLAKALPDTLGQNFVPLYIDLLDARYRTVAGFVETVITELNEKAGDPLAVNGVTDMSSFSEATRELRSLDIRPVLCLDEFEEFTQNSKEFDDDFLEPLRALGGQTRLALVTASRTPLFDLIQAGKLTSPFFNIFTQIELGLLEPDAAQALRRTPFERENVVLSQEEETLIRELGGRYPHYLQMACHHLYEALPRPQDTRADVVRERFDHDAEQHFKLLWNDLNTGERKALKVVTGPAVPAGETEKTLRRLARLGIVEQTDGSWRTFSATFAERVQQYSTKPMVSETPERDEREPRVPEPEETEERALSTTHEFLLFAGVAIVAIVVAAVVGSLVPAQSFRPMLIITAVILLFTLVGAGKLTGHDFLQWLGRLLGLGGS